MNVPFLDISASYHELKFEIDEAVKRVLDSGWYILGPEVEAFEAEWADYCDAKHSVGLANGLDALILALRSLDIGPGDEVIVPSNTFIATWLAVSAVGATPVPVEPDPTTHNIDAGGIAASITPRTKVVLPVHLYGQPVDLDPILTLARKHDLAVVEDAAQAHGARYKGRRIGAHGDIVCWSFYPSKNLGAMGDGGAITTNDSMLAERVARIRNYGSSRKYTNEEKGVNSRLDPMQAAVLRVKLNRLDDWTDHRRGLAQRYAEVLEQTELELPRILEGTESAWHLYVVRTMNREALQQSLTKAGIETLIHYPIPPHMQMAYSNMRIQENSLPIARRLADEVLSLPIGPHMDVKQLDTVAVAIGANVHNQISNSVRN